MLGFEMLTYAKVCFAPLTLRMPKISLRYTIFRFVFLGRFVLMLGLEMLHTSDRATTSYFE